MQSKERPKNNDIDNSLTLMIPIGDGLFVKCTFWLFNHDVQPCFSSGNHQIITILCINTFWYLHRKSNEFTVGF